MAIIRGLQSNMNLLGLFLLALSMILTGVSCASSIKTATSPTSSVVRSSSASPNQTTQSSLISPTPTATTPSSTSVPTTKATAPIITTTPAPSTHGRQFDGASFVGGIILGVVLTVIFIFAFKWWQTRNKSYHSL